MTRKEIGFIGCSAMMQGYIVLDQAGKLLVLFRTWRNTTTAQASSQLTEKFQYKVPQRCSVSHLYQAILNEEKHVAGIDYMTTLSGYVHWRLTGGRILGIGDPSGMFPIDELKNQFNENMLGMFSELISDKDFPWKINDILPDVYIAGEYGGILAETGSVEHQSLQ